MLKNTKQIVRNKYLTLSILTLDFIELFSFQHLLYTCDTFYCQPNSDLVLVKFTSAFILLDLDNPCNWWKHDLDVDLPYWRKIIARKMYFMTDWHWIFTFLFQLFGFRDYFELGFLFRFSFTIWVLCIAGRCEKSKGRGCE